MANKISDETIEYVGILAKLELSEEEKLAARSDMERMYIFISGMTGHSIRFQSALQQVMSMLERS